MSDRQEENMYPQEDRAMDYQEAEYPDDDVDAVGTDHPASPTASQKYAKEKRKAERVWLSGLFNAKSFVPPPEKIDTNLLTESMKEDLLAEETFVVARGYKYFSKDLPAILNSKPTGSLLTAMMIYIILNVIAFIFTLASSTPVPWYRGKDVTIGSANYRGVQFTLWWQKGGDQEKIMVRTMEGCPIEKQFYQTIAASTIMGCVFTFFSLIAAAVKMGGNGSYGWTLLFGMLGFVWTLCGNAMSISQFHLGRCNKSPFVTIARLDAGFALTLIAWVFQLAALLILGFVTRLNIGPVLKQIRVMDAYYLVLLMVALSFMVIANTTTIWKRRFDTEAVRVVRVTYWHTEVIKGDGTPIIYGRAHYRCSAYNKRIKASISFLILGSITAFLAILFGIPAFFSRGCRITSCVLSIITSVFLFISWVTAVAVFYRKLCVRNADASLYASYPGIPTGIYDGYTHFKGYGLQEGVVLSIVAWILCTGAVVLNFVVSWKAKVVA